MPRAKDLIDEWIEQQAPDTEEVLETLVEFIVDHALVEDAVEALCAWIDEQEFAGDLFDCLQQTGVSLDND